jgi:uncharacterized repeat protein (TIGR03806 family)
VRAAKVLGGIVALLIAGCGDAMVMMCAGCGDDAGMGDDGGPPDMTIPAMPAEFGLDTRPSNTTCLAPNRPMTSGGGVAISQVFPNLQFGGITAMRQAPGDSTLWWVINKDGQVLTFPNNQNAQQSDVKTAIDLSAQLNSGGEGGLLGIAFHPNYQTNRYVFLSYTVPSASSAANMRSTVARYTVKNDNTIDGASKQVIFPTDDVSPNAFDQPYDNHKGGNVLFGPDGYLYYGLGDGGSGGDPGNRSQNTTLVFGKMFRVDVDNIPMGKRYGIPADNPFANGAGGNRPDIFAWGLRNPWRWSFDKGTGDLWVGDVGQNAYEEVDVLKLGGNYGWHIMEGFHCYGATTCDMTGLTPPIVEYPHPGPAGDGPASITGGYVYRGSAIPAAVGTYFYADETNGDVYEIAYDQNGTPAHTPIGSGTGNPSSFAEGLDGELYILDYGTGNIYQLKAAGTPVPSTIPAKLSQTGCVDPNDATKPAPGLIPYGVNTPLWSDGAEKARWMAIPDGKQIHVGTDGDWDLPIGTVLMKQFSLGGKPVETRLLMRHPPDAKNPKDVWAGYTYEWNDAGTDADLLPAGKTKQVGAQKWTYPSRSDCLSCHTNAAGRSLGLETAQLNGDFTYVSTLRISNQVHTLDHIGMFDAPIGDPATLPALKAPTSMAPLEDRARSYLHANCSFCHRPMSTGQGPADYRYATTFQMTNACGAMPQEGDLGVMGALLISPGHPEKSLVSLRMHALDIARMPPLATSVVDPDGTNVIDQWIQSLTMCP